MKQDTVKKNFIFQILYQIVMLVLPLIISPILTRRMGSESLGTYIYINGIAYYFIIFANLGIEKYGLRLISKNKDNPDDLRKAFWSLYLVHIIFSLISILFYIGFILLFAKDDAAIYWICLIYVSSALFDITWLFYGLETFKNVVIRNFIVKIISFSLLIAFVKGPEDLMLYAFIDVGVSILGNILLLPIAIKNIKPIKVGKKDLLVHIKPLLIFFISVVASTLYTVFDKTLIGLMTTKNNVAFYEYSNKIINVPKTFIAVVGTVLLPRACNLFKNREFEETNRYASYAYLVASAVGFGTIFGTIALADSFAVIYYGEEFAECGKIIMALSPLPFIICMGDIFRNIYLIPQEKDKEFVISICLAAVFNVVLSLVLIPYLGIMGAVIGTIAAEVFATLIQAFCCRKNIILKDITKSMILFATVGAAMFGVIVLVKHFMPNTLVSLIVEFVIGISTFGLLSLLVIFVFYKDFKNRLFSSVIKLFKHFKKKTEKVE